MRREERGERLDEQSHELCVDLTWQLHADGRIVETLRRPLTVILYDMTLRRPWTVVLYDMFDPDEIFALTRAANPAELVTEFLAEDPEGH
ncbi:hypothetical protein [Streptosporangium roseum]|uniref:hypothetical protein n=1 Tax=Streptosporangium roseum TaxID=2001 RepID=UPI0004CCB155|nr:hypothetical protein [Streptosporangium roseum]